MKLQAVHTYSMKSYKVERIKSGTQTGRYIKVMQVTRRSEVLHSRNLPDDS